MRDFGKPMLIVFYQIITKDYLTFKIIYHKEFFKLSVLITSSRYLRTDYEQILCFTLQLTGYRWNMPFQQHFLL